MEDKTLSAFFRPYSPLGETEKSKSISNIRHLIEKGEFEKSVSMKFQEFETKCVIMHSVSKSWEILRNLVLFNIFGFQCVKREQLLRLNVSIYIILSELRTERFEFASEGLDATAYTKLSHISTIHILIVGSMKISSSHICISCIHVIPGIYFGHKR